MDPELEKRMRGARREMEEKYGEDKLMSPSHREALRDTMSGWTLREIDELWHDELFPPGDDAEPVGGQRVTRFQGHLQLG